MCGVGNLALKMTVTVQNYFFGEVGWGTFKFFSFISSPKDVISWLKKTLKKS